MKLKVLCLMSAICIVLGGSYLPQDKFFAASTEVITEDIMVDFEYPITPDDEAWKELESIEEKIKVCRIPDEILKKMTDEQLIQAILDFPFLYDVFLAPTEEAGVESLKEICDAYAELLTRPSAKEDLLHKVNQQVGVYSNNISAMNELESDALKNLILYQDDYVDGLSVQGMNELIQFSTQMTRDDSVMPLAATCQHDSETYHEELDQYTVDTYDVELVSGGSCLYNCHAYAWITTSARYSTWLSNPRNYIENGGYEQVADGPFAGGMSVIKNDRVFYGTFDNPTHSAIVTSGVSPLTVGQRVVTSKWGSAGVFRHKVINVPSAYDIINISVWRD